MFSTLLQQLMCFSFLYEKPLWPKWECKLQRPYTPSGSTIKQCPSLKGYRKPSKDLWKSPNPILKVEASQTSFSLWWPPNCLTRAPLSPFQAAVPGNRCSESCSRLGFYWGRPGPALVSVKWTDWVHYPWCASPTPTGSGESTWARSRCGGKEIRAKGIN